MSRFITFSSKWLPSDVRKNSFPQGSYFIFPLHFHDISGRNFTAEFWCIFVKEMMFHIRTVTWFYLAVQNIETSYSSMNAFVSEHPSRNETFSVFFCFSPPDLRWWPSACFRQRLSRRRWRWTWGRPFWPSSTANSSAGLCRSSEWPWNKHPVQPQLVCPRFPLNYILKEMALGSVTLQTLTPPAPRSCRGWERLQGTARWPASRWASGRPRHSLPLRSEETAGVLQGKVTKAKCLTRFTAPLTLCRSQMSGVEDSVVGITPLK